MRRLTLLMCLLAIAAVAFAQDKPAASASPAGPASSFNKEAYNHVKQWLISSAEKMPGESYSFKPVDSVRSYGQIIGHLADAQYMFCSAALGEKNPALRIEKTKTSKADLTAALKEAVAYCDKAYDGMTDAAGAAPVQFFHRDMSKLNVLTANLMHDAEHYGNLVTYMRMKNIVPPSTEQAQQAQQQQAPTQPKK